MKPESREITELILEYIDRYQDAEPRDEEAERAFEAAMLKVFAYQFNHQSAYRKYCQARRRTPLNVRRWQDIPPIPIQAFKELTLACEPPEEAEAVFMTSGTTNVEKRGRNYHPTLAVWNASMAPPFRQYVLRDWPAGQRIRMLVLSPAADVNVNSSLSRYLSRAVELYGTEDSLLLFKPGSGLDMGEVADALADAERRGEPVLLLGATFAYVHVLDALAERGLMFQLPAGSRILDTGGLKGQAREVTNDELLDGFRLRFGVVRDGCINMYGMTELSSQLYDRSFGGTSLALGKQGPPWIRTLVLDSDTLAPLPDCRTGVLAHYDLANWNSCCAILTEDVGYRDAAGGGLILLGRIQGSEARGCSIAVDQLLRGGGRT